MPKIIGSSTTVVEIDGLKIDELAGNVATSEDIISIAYVTVSEPTSEPWLTLDYDEWLCVLKGKMILHYTDGGNERTLEVNAGETCMVAKGERFRPVFPIAPTEYIPVCSPAFRPDRCHREEGEESSDVTKNLIKLHSGNKELQCTSSDKKDVLYHMCQKTLWEEASHNGKAYYSPTFETDGFFTHATAVPERLIETANHFYTQTLGEWICLELSRSALENIGIITKDEQPLPVADAVVSENWVKNNWVCPHIYGGIPTVDGLNVLQKIHPIIRTDDGKFVNIDGLTE
uniref:Cupin n=1 Tax=Eucampia antarctica TaxID=49252 RepID=A0A7S2RPF2_9STRA